MKAVSRPNLDDLEAQATIFDLAPKLDVKAATELKQALLPLLEGAGPVCLRAAGVNRICTAACQLLIAFIIAMRDKNRQVQIIEPSAQLSGAFALLGLSEFLTGTK